VLAATLEAPGFQDTLGHIARLARVNFNGAPDGAEPVAVVSIPDGRVQIFASAELNAEAAQARLAVRRAKLELDIDRAERKLGNEGFVAKAPPPVVQAEREKLARLTAERDSL
jgi:valyl-tRNA synthetase